jgi:serine/threonine protein kinase
MGGFARRFRMHHTAERMRAGWWVLALCVLFTSCCVLVQSLHMLRDCGVYGLRRGTPEFNAVAEELLQEARLLHSLRHDNILQLRGVVLHPEHGHVQWLVMEYADGGSLEAWVSARGRMTLKELLEVLSSVMQGLAHLHSRMPAVQHREVKRSNVLVFTKPGGGIVFKLGDVGTVKVLHSTHHARSSAGTPIYTAPEILRGAHDGKVDVFSTGIMAAELVVRYMDVAGFERAAATHYLHPEHRAALVEDACARLDTVCPSLSTVVRDCSADRAERRISSAAALHALQEIISAAVVDTHIPVVGSGGVVKSAFLNSRRGDCSDDSGPTGARCGVQTAPDGLHADDGGETPLWCCWSFSPVFEVVVVVVCALLCLRQPQWSTALYARNDSMPYAVVSRSSFAANGRRALP